MKQFAPVYLLDGEESFYIDLLVERFENDVMSPQERDFNLITFYGKDVSWADVVNACRRFPMFAERQVVILKDAGQLKGLNDLAGYLEKPSLTTVFVIDHRNKKADGKTRLVKMAKDKYEYFTSEKIKDDKMPGWIQDYGREIGFSIGEKEAQVLTSHLGNDLQKIANELAKVRINLPNERELTAANIHKYIGVSREYNIFEFPEAVTGNDRDKMYKMLNYFLVSPKAAPMTLILTSFYTQFSRMYIAHFVRNMPEKDAAAAIGIPPFRLGATFSSLNNWPLPRVERALFLMGKYSTMAVGIKNNSDDRELLKELVAQLIM